MGIARGAKADCGLDITDNALILCGKFQQVTAVVRCILRNYAGYVAWRGLVDEPELTDEAAALLRDRFSFFEYPNSHMLAYLVPGEHEAIEPGKRRYN